MGLIYSKRTDYGNKLTIEYVESTREYIIEVTTNDGTSVGDVYTKDGLLQLLDDIKDRLV